MSKQEAISRYNLIIRKIRKYPATFPEIAAYLALESEMESCDYTISKRTFQRDIKDIQAIYKIDIQYDFSRMVYYIEHDDQSMVNERILEAFDTFNALNLTDRISDHIHFEKRKPQGTENLHGLLQAIRNRLQVRFSYQKYWDEELTHRHVEPYALKEFKNRWYLLAKDLKDDQVKSFALDRLTNPEITKKTFQYPGNYDVNAHYRHCFGIVGPNGQQPEQVVLSFDPIQGKYIKSLPLHESQVILKDDQEELQIMIKVVLTYDFLMELLSQGDKVKVLKPAKLIDKLKTVYQGALKQYSTSVQASERRLEALRVLSVSLDKTVAEVSQDKPVHFVGLGKAGCKALEYIYSKGIEAKYTGITDPGIQLSPSIDFIPFSSPKQIRYKTNGEEIRISDLDQKFVLPDQIKELFNEDCHYIILAALGGFTGTYMAKELTLMLQDQKMSFRTICSLPFPFEGKPKNRIAESALQRLLPVPGFRYFSLDSFSEYYDNLTLSEAFEKADEHFYLVFKKGITWSKV